MRVVPARIPGLVAADLATIVRSTCSAPNAVPDAPTFKIVTTLNAQQQRALDLIQEIHV